MPVLYYLGMTPPCRAVLLTAKAIELDFELRIVDIKAGNQHTPEFIKLNPQHTVPTLDDNGFVLFESRPMMAYLVDKYAKDDALYPKDLYKRAMVDTRLYFDIGTLYPGLMAAYYPIFLASKKPTEAGLAKLDTALEFLEAFLTQTTYVAGDTLTIADITIAATLSTIEVCGHSFAKFPKVTAYYDRLKTEIIGYQEINQTGLDDFGSFIAEKLKSAE